MAHVSESTERCVSSMSRTKAMMARMLTLAGVLIGMSIVGCATNHADWYAIHDARGELAALRESPYAALVTEELSSAAELVAQADEALANKQHEIVAQIAQLALLRIEIAHAVGVSRVARDEEDTATKALEAVVLRVDARRKELSRAQDAMRGIQQPTGTPQEITPASPQ